MSRSEGLKMSMEIIQDIENNKEYSTEDKKYWTTRVLLADIASSLAAIADKLCNAKPLINCNTCKHEDKEPDDKPCIYCNKFDEWEAKE